MNKMRKQILKKYAVLGTGISIIMIGFGLYAVASDIKYVFPNPTSAPIGFILVGVLSLLFSVAPWIESFKYNRAEEIERKDERNRMIIYLACYYSYQGLLFIGILSLILLAMLGYMNKVSFFVLITIFIISNIGFYVSKYYLNLRF